MFENITDVIKPSLRAQELDRYVTKVWEYKTICAVVDFTYKGLKFAFNYTPTGEGRVDCDLVQRKSKIGAYATRDGSHKEHLAQNISLAEALDVTAARARSIFEATDQYLRGDQPVQPDLPMTASAAPASRIDRIPHAGSDARTVGVVTLPIKKNIGGTLQAYALLETLRQLGWNPVLINRRHPSKDHEIPQPGSAEFISPTFTGLNKGAPNNQFIETHLAPFSRPFHSSKELTRAVDRHHFDAIIVGSDQIWRPKYAGSILSDLFLGFVPENTAIRRISYAASFGSPSWEFSPEQTQQAAHLLSRFDAVSVREDSAAELCEKHLGVSARHVLDPTMLLAGDHYKQLCAFKQGQQDGNYLATYILDDTDDKSGVVEAISKALSVKAYGTDGKAFGPGRKDDKGKGDRSIEAWLASLSQSDFVVTDSFHGMAFSIIFNRPFIVYGNPARGMARFSSLLKMFDLEDRLIVHSDGMNLDQLLKPIDWSAVNAKMASLRQQSLEFLRTALAKGDPSDNPPPPPMGVGQDAPVTDGGDAGSTAHLSSDPDVASANHPLNVLCTGCGACVSESDGALRMGWNDDGFLVPQALSGDVPARAVRVCPFNPRPERQVEDEDALANIFLAGAGRSDPTAGRFEQAYIGYSNDFRMSSSSGGIATYVFDQLLRQGEVDHVFVVKSDGAGRYKYQFHGKADDIKTLSKTRYYPVTLEDLFLKIAATEGRVAVSGVACFIKAIRLKQYYHPELRKKIPFLVGIICGGLKSRMYTDYLAQRAGVSGAYRLPEYRLKNLQGDALDYSFSATDENAAQHSVRMRQVGDMWGTGLFKSKACDFCTDVLTELSDISVGDAWLPAYKSDGSGNSVIVTRTALAEKIIQGGIERGELSVQTSTIDQIVKSQAGGVNHKHNGVKFRIWMSRFQSTFQIPVIRSRFLKDLSLGDALVQVQRERTRAKSLVSWKQTRNAGRFERRMRASLKGLKVAMASRSNGTGRDMADILQSKESSPDARHRISATGGQVMLRWLTERIKGGLPTSGPVQIALRDGAVITDASGTRHPAEGAARDLPPLRG